jgi:hypothetical protein
MKVCVLALLVLKVLHVILVEGGKGKPDLGVGLGYQKMTMPISDLIIIKQCDIA